MGACWRSLASNPMVKLKVFALNARPNAPFQDDVFYGLDFEVLDWNADSNTQIVENYLIETGVDVVVVPGWASKQYMKLVFSKSLRHIKFVLAMDTPWTGSVRQLLATIKLRSYTKRMARAVVSGERAYQYARRLGFAKNAIRNGLYGIDGKSLEGCLARREEKGWPRAFFYAGRFEEIKGIRVLLDAYARYRQKCCDPWPLIACGTGPLSHLAQGVEGVDYRGFVQPSSLPHIIASAGVFVLASTYDPWPLVLVEACAAGLPVIHTDACGSSVELVRPYFNGVSVATGDAISLSGGMKWCHDNASLLPLMGSRSGALAEAYHAENWSTRWYEWLLELTSDEIATL